LEATKIRKSKKKTDYFSHDLVWALITSKIKDELFNKEDVVFLQPHYN
jgi:hypothetical protein